MAREGNTAPRRLWLWAAAPCLLRLSLHFLARAVHGGYTFLISSVELARTQDALAWADKPGTALQDGGVYWLPLPFVLEGTLLRFWRDPFAVPFALNGVFSLLTVAGVAALALEISGTGAALAAGFACALSATGVALGVGGAADPLLHAGLIWGLWFWARCERSGRAADAVYGGLCLLAAGLARYEAWPVGLAGAAALLWKRGRAARPAAALAVAAPAAWMLYCLAVAGDPFAFLKQTLQANVVRPRMLEAFLRDAALPVPGWILVLAAIGAGAAGAPVVVWSALAALVCVFALPAPWVMMQIDEHPWAISALALPPAAAALSAWLRPLAPRRRAAAWAAVAALYAGTQLLLWRDYSYEFDSVQRPFVDAFFAVRSLRASGALAPADNVLFEEPEAASRVNFFHLWQLDRPAALFDRSVERGAPLPIGPAGRAANPSALDGAAVSDWLRERRVRLAVIGSRQARMKAAGFVKISDSDGLSLWTRPDDPLAAALR